MLFGQFHPPRNQFEELCNIQNCFLDRQTLPPMINIGASTFNGTPHLLVYINTISQLNLTRQTIQDFRLSFEPSAFFLIFIMSMHTAIFTTLIVHPCRDLVVYENVLCQLVKIFKMNNLFYIALITLFLKLGKHYACR